MTAPASPTDATGSPSLKSSMNAVLSDMERAERCAYPSKPCSLPCAVKLNGDLHNFCNFHRRKANMNQRRWQQRRRRLRGTDAPQSPLTPRALDTRATELETAQAVAMLHRVGEYYPPPQAVPRWPQYPSHASEDEWSPRAGAPLQLPRQFLSAPVFRPIVNVLPSTLPRTFPYVVKQSHSPTMAIPPLHSLPALLPSSFLGNEARPTRPMSAHVSTY